MHPRRGAGLQTGTEDRVGGNGTGSCVFEANLSSRPLMIQSAIELNQAKRKFWCTARRVPFGRGALAIQRISLQRVGKRKGKAREVK